MNTVFLEFDEHELKETMIALEIQYDRFADSNDIEKADRANILWTVINKVANARRDIRYKRN